MTFMLTKNSLIILRCVDMPWVSIFTFTHLSLEETKLLAPSERKRGDLGKGSPRVA